MNWLDTLLSLPEVCDFLMSDEWTWDFPPQFIDRGRRLSDSAKVLAVDHFIGSRSGFVGTARIQGSRVQPYKVSINGRVERGEWIFWGSCGCPVGEDCKHVAAFVIDLRKAIKAERNVFDSEDNHDLWLNALSTALVPEKKPKKPTEPSRKTAALAYLVTLRDDGLLRVSFGKIAYPSKDGLPRVENDSLSPNIRSRVPAYFQEGDAELTFALQNRIPKSPDSDHYWYEVRVLRGAYSESLLPQMLESGRLFLADEFSKSRSTPFPGPLAAGPSLLLGAQWDVSESGDCRPAIGLPSTAVRLIEIDGPHYLDLENHHIGPVVVAEGQSLALLRLWMDGPIVTTEAAARLTVEMEGRGIPVAIPRPVTLEEKELKYDGVIPILTISRSPVLESLRQPAFGGAVRVAVPPLPTVALAFRYGDHEISFGSDFPKSSRLAVEGYLLVIERDVTFEANEIKRLLTAGIQPLTEIFDREYVSKDYRHHFGVDEAVEDWDFTWARHVAETMPLLKKAGWEIRYDSTFDLSVTEAADVFTDLSEDPDKGIDWFQFDTGIVTTEGQRQSLMDLIANFLRSNDEIPEDEAFDDDDQRVLVTDESGKSFFNLPAKRFFRIVRSVRDLFDRPDDGLHRLEAAALAEELELDESKTLADLRALGEQLRKKEPHLPVELPTTIKAELRDYQKDGFQWLQFLARHHLHGILADDMGLGKTLQALAHIAAEVKNKRHEGQPSLVVAPTSVVPNWAAEAKKFTPSLKVLVLHGSDRQADFKKIDKHHIVITSYALLQRDQAEHRKHTYHLALLDEAQYIKNPKAKVSIAACKLDARHRVCLSGTPMENHLGELWSLVRFLMPGLLGNEQTFNKIFRTPIERHHDSEAQRALNARVGNLILRRTKDQVVLELPPKTEIIHRITLNKEQQEIYESVRTAMDSKVRDAIADKGLARSQIIVLDALLKLRQVCCHPQLIKTEISKKAKRSAKLDFLVDLLATLIEEGRRILLFSQFTTMLALIEDHLKKEKIKYVKITGATRDRKTPVETFQEGKTPVFLISLKAGGTGLNLTAADTVIHYDPWWNPAAENQATDRAHRIGQTNPVFVHKLVSEGSIEERILDLQARKSRLVEALLSEETSKLKLDTETLGNLLAPIDV